MSFTAALKIILRCVLLAGVAGQALPASAQARDADPFIEVNRSVYNFNEALDELIIKPVTRSYDYVMPDMAKRGVTNFFNNLDDVNVVVNDVLQGKVRNAARDSGRLVLNSTIGIAGFIDVASGFGLYKNNEDFGQTFGYWGIGPGPYLVVPFLGNYTLRDAIGFIPDYLFNPIFWIHDEMPRHGLYAMDTVDTRLYYLAAESMITGDEYVFVRDAYLQRREYLVADGEVYDEWDEF